MTIRASLEVSFGRTKSFGGFEVGAGSCLVVDSVGSGVCSFGLGFERVARAIVLCMFDWRCYVKIMAKSIVGKSIGDAW